MNQTRSDKVAIQKKIQKLEKKRSRDKIEQMKYADAHFEMAECNKTLADTNYKSDYIKAIKSYKDLFNKDPSGENKIRAIFKIGLSYFNIEDYNSAVIYFQKVLCVGKNTNTEALYYFGGCLAYLKRCSEANIEFKNYYQLTKDTVRTKEFIKLCAH